jgi:hypothetical protein
MTTEDVQMTIAKEPVAVATDAPASPKAEVVGRVRNSKFDASLLPESTDPAEMRKQVRFTVQLAHVAFREARSLFNTVLQRWHT